MKIEDLNTRFNSINNGLSNFDRFDSDKLTIAFYGNDNYPVGILRQNSTKPSWDIREIDCASDLRILVEKQVPLILIINRNNISTLLQKMLVEFGSMTHFATIILCSDEEPKFVRSEYGGLITTLPSNYTFGNFHEALNTCKTGIANNCKEEFENASQNNEFILEYQATVTHNNKGFWKLCDVEALSRWHHPSRGLLYPASFLNKLDIADVNEGFSLHVITQVAEQLHIWDKSGYLLDARINLHAKVLQNKTFLRLLTFQNMWNLDPTRITFEFSERDILNFDNRSIRGFQSLLDAGYSLSLDDFSHSCSTVDLHYFFKFNEVKIHSSILKRALKNPLTMDNLRRSVIKLKDRGITICAEGVENNNLYQLAKVLCCDKMQGYFVEEAIKSDVISLEKTIGEDTTRLAAIN